MKVSQVYAITREELTRLGTGNPEQEARFITSWICEIPPGRLPLEGEVEIEGVFGKLASILSRRRKREPLQLIIGKWDFYGREFLLKKGVLVPRPETEVLIDEALKRLRQIGNRDITGLDVGSGVGNLCVTLLAEMGSINMVAVDLSEKAVMTTVKNARVHGVSERLTVLRGDFKDCFREKALFDFIISNPPYMSRLEFKEAMPEVREHEPEEALVGGDDGLECIADLIRFAAAGLAPWGLLFFEFGIGQGVRVQNLVEGNGNLEKCEIIDDLAGIPRVAVARRR